MLLSRFFVLMGMMTTIAGGVAEARPRTDMPGTDLPGTDLPPTDLGPLTISPPTDVQPTDTVAQAIALFQVTSNALPSTTVCTFSLQVDATNLVQGAVYACNDGTPVQIYTVADFMAGVAIVHDDNRDVVVASAPGFDINAGGQVTMHYLNNGITGSYSDWYFNVVNTGTSWEAYTLPEDGQAAFNHMYFEKATFLGETIGISQIETSWASD